MPTVAFLGPPGRALVPMVDKRIVEPIAASQINHLLRATTDPIPARGTEDSSNTREDRDKILGTLTAIRTDVVHRR
jgi:hypothetical protein